jgi:SpoVK/Ycf46/Vps4 family AAA+-type ATPase
LYKHKTDYAIRTNTIDTKYYKILSSDVNEYYSIKIYNGVMKSKSELYNLYFKPFFNSHKDKLLDFLHKMEDNPELFIKNGQSPSMNLLLHGPMGCGKTSFVYRVAMYLNRDIISVNISTLTKNRRDLYELFNVISFYNNNNKCVILLEEFDKMIDKLENTKQSLMSLLKKSEKSNKSNTNINNFDRTLNDCSVNNNSDSDDIYENPDTIIVNDLLELLQGPVPTPGRIVIATSNDYEKLVNKYPPLFRVGRLNPIKFDYLNWETFQELVNYYFNKFPTMKPIDSINIPIVEIIQDALNYQNMNDGLELFQTCIKSKIKF